MDLEKYEEKRGFPQTPELQEKALQFVVQLHQASTVHYDFRLEMAGVLKSWVIPKGPSMNPIDRRLAIMVEDHPLEYRTFQGEIPEGSYGAGLVQILDKGTYHAEEGASREEEERLLIKGLEEGSFSFVLEGNLLQGAFVLIKMKKGEPNTWLLIKKSEEDATESPYDKDGYLDGSKAATLKAVSPKLDKANQVSKQAKPVNAGTGIEVDIAGHSLTLTNLDKVYWPQEGYTKGELIHYYRLMASYILPYLQNRPQSLHRHPNGLLDAGFFQKEAGGKLPEWVETVKIYSKSSDREVNYFLCQNEAILTYLNNLGCIELHPWHSRIDSLPNPDYLVMDLDPGENTFDEVVEVALAVKEVMEKAEAKCYCKTSGATGLHIYVPLGRQFRFKRAQVFAHRVAELVHEQLPELTSLARSPKVRKKQIYLDYMQNNMGQTLVAPYSVRAQPGATVSTPLLWEEVKKGLQPAAFTIRTVPERLSLVGDIFGGIQGVGFKLEGGLKILNQH